MAAPPKPQRPHVRQPKCEDLKQKMLAGNKNDMFSGKECKQVIEYLLALRR